MYSRIIANLSNPYSPDKAGSFLAAFQACLSSKKYRINDDPNQVQQGRSNREHKGDLEIQRVELVPHNNHEEQAREKSVNNAFLGERLENRNDEKENHQIPPVFNFIGQQLVILNNRLFFILTHWLNLFLLLSV